VSQKALYRKYRSTSFDEILGQSHIVDSLEKAVKAGAFSHAYLFTGPRGVGKTSIARLLAHKIIGADYGGDNPEHIDIIEIDAASNTGVDDVRELREKAYVSPAQASYKIYIIDEVHMLSKAAFNALLKILEEPPAHVIFILATTEAHKVPATVASRTQRFGFRPIAKSLLAEHIQNIAKTEKIKIDPEAAALIATYSHGSFRDAISLLDQLQHSGEITSETVRKSLGQLDEARLRTITEAVTSGDISQIISALDAAYSEGAQAVEIAQQLARYWRGTVINGNALQSTDMTMSLIEQLLDVGQSTDPELALEVVLVKATPSQAIQKPAPAPSETVEPPDALEASEESVTPEVIIASTQPEKPASTYSGTISEAQWNQILERVKQFNNSLYALVRMSHMIADDGKLTLTFGFPFHHRRMQEKRNQDVLQEALKAEFGKGFEIVCVLDEASKKPVPEPTAPPDKSADIIDVLGGEMVSI
jgi:DNA polymerase-3 subunit gamma/tau